MIWMKSRSREIYSKSGEHIKIREKVESEYTHDIEVYLVEVCELNPRTILVRFFSEPNRN